MTIVEYTVESIFKKEIDIIMDGDFVNRHAVISYLFIQAFVQMTTNFGSMPVRALYLQ